MAEMKILGAKEIPNRFLRHERPEKCQPTATSQRNQYPQRKA
jgi:hypothetical protein